MAYVIENFNSWNESQTQLRELLGINDDKIRCFPYYGLGHALTDLLYGLKEFWPTRKNLALGAFGSPLLKDAVSGFVREGVAVQFFENPRKNSLDEWFNALPKDLLTAILVRDHCLTGQILASDDEFLKLNEKRIPHVEVQYAWGFSHANLPHPFGAQIRVIDSEKAVVVMGHRFRLMSHSANLINWTSLNWEPSLKVAIEQSRDNQEWVEGFEKSLETLQTSIKVYYSKNSSRLFDRSVLNLNGVNGDFFLARLLKYLKQPPILPAGYEVRGETTNLSRWQGPMSWPWWGATPLSELEQRSLVVLSASFIREQLTAEIINAVYLQCCSELNKNWEKVS